MKDSWKATLIVAEASGTIGAQIKSHNFDVLNKKRTHTCHAKQWLTQNK